MHKRLQKEKEVQKVFLKGRNLCFRDVCVRWVSNELKSTRFAFLCGKKNISLAVSRNTLRRRMRESVRKVSGEIVSGADIVLMFRGKKVIPSQEVRECVETLLKRANLLKKNND